MPLLRVMKNKKIFGQILNVGSNKKISISLLSKRNNEINKEKRN